MWDEVQYCSEKCRN
ncbi:MAG: DUF2256 domain-containing protein [Legionella sp.]|nr:DUF2256 domain-containing protein [Legionella sp.]